MTSKNYRAIVVAVSYQERSPKVIAVVGAQWGDEGKGKVVDLLAQDADVVIRSHGGDNAGHTVRNSNGEFKLHLVPAGIFNPETLNIIGAGVALNLKTLKQEVTELERRGVSTGNLFICSKTHLAFEYHLSLDKMQEESRGVDKIGTTKRGIGPTYMDKAERIGLRAHLLNDPKELLYQLSKVLCRKRKMLASLSDGEVKVGEEFYTEYYEKLVEEAAGMFAERVIDTQALVQKHLATGHTFVLEGAHGTLLDLDHGTYPNVTSSNSSIYGILNGAEIPPRYLTRTIGVYKAYQTRVGSGGMPTELFDKKGELIREKGNEYGTTTGRPRRVGFFDGVAARYANEINGFTDIAITRLDILPGIGDLKICQSYIRKGDNNRFLDRFPSEDRILSQYEAFYNQRIDTYPGFEEEIDQARELTDLPEEAYRYVQAIHKSIPGTNLYLVGVGADRNSVIINN